MSFEGAYIKVYLEGNIFDGAIHISGDEDLLDEYKESILAMANNNPPLLTHLATLSRVEGGWYLALDDEGDLINIDNPELESKAAVDAQAFINQL